MKSVFKLFKLVLLCSVLFLTVLTSGVQAQSHYFQVDVPVASQAGDERKRAAAMGLENVLMRVSGVTNLIGNEEVDNALSRAERYIEQFTFTENKDPQAELNQLMSMTFSAGEIQKLLQRASLPYWPLNRPTVLVWLVEDSIELGKTVVVDTDNAVMQGIQATASARGLPVTLPLWDLEDQFAIEAEQLWYLDESSIMQASQRYGTDTILVGRYTLTSTGMLWSTWQYFHKSPSKTFDFKTQEPQLLGAGAVHALADTLAQLYAISPTAQGGNEYIVEVNQVQGFKDYDRILGYFDKLAAVDSSMLSRIVGSQIYLNVTLKSDKQKFENALALDGFLEPIVTGESVFGPTNNWVAVTQHADKQAQSQMLPLLQYNWTE